MIIIIMMMMAIMIIIIIIIIIITSLLRQNDVATSFRRNNDVIITSCAPGLCDAFALSRHPEISSISFKWRLVYGKFHSCQRHFEQNMSSSVVSPVPVYNKARFFFMSYGSKWWPGMEPICTYGGALNLNSVHRYRDKLADIIIGRHFQCIFFKFKWLILKVDIFIPSPIDNTLALVRIVNDNDPFTLIYITMPQ